MLDDADDDVVVAEEDDEAELDDCVFSSVRDDSEMAAVSTLGGSRLLLFCVGGLQRGTELNDDLLVTLLVPLE